MKYWIDKKSFLLMIVGFMVIFSLNSFAVDYDEHSPCYANCLKTRESCANKCMQKFNNNKSEQMYSCMHQCDGPFNNTCVKKCPKI